MRIKLNEEQQEDLANYLADQSMESAKEMFALSDIDLSENTQKMHRDLKYKYYIGVLSKLPTT